MSFNKNGIIKSSNFIDGCAGNILKGNNYTIENPCVLSGTNKDVFSEIHRFAKVTPGKKYYLTAKTTSPWASGHLGDYGTVSIWLYLKKVYDETNWSNYDRPICFTKTGLSYIKDGLWYYTIPDGYNMASVRVNTYSNGTDQVTVNFWDINLIPEEDFIQGTTGMRILNKQITTGELAEY